MAMEASPKLKEPQADVDYESNLPYPNPKTPQEEFANDIVISLRQVKAGDVIDADLAMARLRAELGLDAD